MPKRKYYGYYCGQYRGRGSYSFVAHMLAYPIAIIILIILASITSPPGVTILVVLGLIVLGLIVKAQGGKKGARALPNVLPCGHNDTVGNVFYDFGETKKCRRCAKERRTTAPLQSIGAPALVPVQVLPCGHEYNVNTVYLGCDGKRFCRICLKERMTPAASLRSGTAHVPVQALPCGHDDTAANRYFGFDGKKKCSKCLRERRMPLSLRTGAPTVYPAPAAPREGELVITEYVNHRWRTRTIDTMNEG